MTRKEALAKLITAVEANSLATVSAEHIYVAFGAHLQRRFWECWNGSLDAVKALHEAVLPDFIAYPEAGGASVGVRVWSCTVESWIEGQEYHGSNQPEPSRAWLLSILRALHAQETAA